MFFLLAYAVAIWAICFTHRRRWPAFVAPIAGLAPVALVTHMDVLFIFSNENGTALWLYIVAGAFMALILGVGLFIAVLPRNAADDPCPACGYDQSGAISEICSECGCDVTARKPRRTRPHTAPDADAAPPERSLATQLASTAPERRARSLASR